MRKFEDLVKKVSPELLMEKYYKYVLPSDPETKLYDFYMLSYLKNIINQPSENFRDLKPDLVDSVNDAIKTCFTELRSHLLDVIFYSICAEIRHAFRFTSSSNYPNLKVLKSDSDEYKIFKPYMKYMIYHHKANSEKLEYTEFMGLRAPRSKTEIPGHEVQNEKQRNLSFKAANYAVKKSKLDRSVFIKGSSDIFKNGSWTTGYGGNAWANIADGWLFLNNSSDIDPVEFAPKKKMSIQDKHKQEKQDEQEKIYGKYFGKNDQ